MSYSDMMRFIEFVGEMVSEYYPNDDIAKKVMRRAQSFKEEDFTTCECLPACSSLHYDVEIFQAKFDLYEYYKTLSSSYELDDE